MEAGPEKVPSCVLKDTGTPDDEVAIEAPYSTVSDSTDSSAIIWQRQLGRWRGRG